MSNHQRNLTRSKKPRKNKPFSIRKKFVLIISLLLITPLLYQIKPVSSSITIHVPYDYDSIQDAIDNAAIGDTIQVAPGIYYEQVIVDKNVTIVGENLQTTIVDGTVEGESGIVFNLNADNINITGFTIRNAGETESAILSESKNNRIYNNIITTSQYGVSLMLSDQNKIFNNTFISNYFGAIFLSNSKGNTITGNIIKDGAYGIKAETSINNIIVGNTITNTSFAIHLTSSSTGNTIQRNFISGKTAGVYSASDSTTVDHNTITDGAYGIYLYNCKNGSIYYNTIRYNSYGIRLYSYPAATSSHNVKNNKIQNNDWAIELALAHGNTFTGNWLQQNTYGMNFLSSNTNTMYHNNFVHNHMQVSGTGSGNKWNTTNQGNYWSDYSGTGVYNTTTLGTDNYPLKTTWSEHDIAIQSVTPSTYEVDSGATIEITVTVKNNANISVSETFSVTTKYNSAIIETKTVTNLAKGATQILTFNWDTTGVPPGDYVISAETSTVPDELNTDNNQLTDGTVTVRQIHDIAVISIQCSRSIAYVGYGDIYIEVEIKNEGPNGETFSVTVYRNSTPIDTKPATLDSGATTVLNFTWTTSGVTPGIYNISAIAPPLLGETDTADNSLTDVFVRLKIPGDVNGDKTVDVFDAADVSAHWYPGPPIGPLGYDSNADINNDGTVNVIDAAIVSANWGKTET